MEINTPDPSIKLNHKARLVSVIIPNYNHAHFLGEAIQSVLGQSYHDFEIIVVDDGSTDNTREVVAKFGSQVRYIWQENQGLSAARNTGIRAARGEIIGLLDADDLYEPDFLSTLVPLLYNDPEADAVYCASQFVDETNRALPQQTRMAVTPERLYDKLLHGGFFPPLCLVAYKYCYERAGLFDSSFQGCADWDMWLRMSRRFRIIGTDQLLARYRVVSHSMSTDPLHMLDDRNAVLLKQFGDNSSDFGQRKTDQRKAFGRSYLKTAIDYLQLHDIEQAYQNVRLMFNTSPELAGEFDIFDELAWGDQARGFRGDFLSWDLLHNAQILINIADRLVQDPQVDARLKKQRRRVYANAYLALGLLSYGSRSFREAQYYLIRALAFAPSFGFKSQVVCTLLKSLLGTRLFRFLRRKMRR